VTKGRVSMLVFLSRSSKPLTASEIQKGMGHTIDKVTLYRALEDFEKSKIITKVNLHGAATYYELIHEGHHHHHIVCEKCGRIEDIENCNQGSLQKEILKRSKSFVTISSHSLEFFGICKSCK